MLRPAGKDPEALPALLDRARELHEEAAGQGRRGWAVMYRGLVTDDHFADRAAAAPHYAAALRAGEGDADGLPAREALRHLGGHGRDAGDHERARERRGGGHALPATAGRAGPGAGGGHRPPARGPRRGPAGCPGGRLPRRDAA
ncbi:hypothetical protein Scel_20710 [Streptomyces cellostaticus]|uniref:hypothetical protein n=1 Tax=Streptomyces cellostaticus TaxID=67285 RepID=UPI0025CB0107|nr:hypothetical protein [Streptomyces cellostaticus]GHI03750.1 hypothetical protein Scel_20710 [Streptomyces cellostaticus]